MAAVFHTFSSGIGEASTFTPTRPSGTTSGDLLILHFSGEKGSDVSITNLSSQWTEIRVDTQSTNIRQTLAWRQDDGSGLLPLLLSQACKFSWAVSRIAGHDPDNPIHTHAGANAASGNPDPPSFTTTLDDCLAFAFASSKTQTTYTPPTNYTERYDNPNTSGGIPAQSGASRLLASAATENPGTFAPGSASEWVAATVAIAPSPSDESATRSPGTIANFNPGFGVAWTSPGNAASSDNSYAQSVATTGTGTQYLRATNFGFTIPSGATIDGIFVEVEARSSASSGSLGWIYNLWKDGTGYTTGSNANLTNSDAYYSWGSTTDLWGTTWSPSDINASSFGIDYRSFNNNHTSFVDHVQISVWYTESGTQTSQTQAVRAFGHSQSDRAQSVRTSGQDVTSTDYGVRVRGTDPRKARVTWAAFELPEVHQRVHVTRVTGQNQTTVERVTRAYGQDTATAERVTRATGQATASTSYAVRATGNVSEVTDERAVRTTGEATVSLSTVTRTHGQAQAALERPVRVQGQAAASMALLTRVTGQTTDQTTQSVRVHAQDTTSSAFTTRATGQDTSSLAITVTARGQTASSASFTTRVHGRATAYVERDVRTVGNAEDSTSYVSRVSGQESIDLSIEIRATGEATSNAERQARLFGALLSDKSVTTRLHGTDTTSKTVGVRITGTAQVQSNRSQAVRLVGEGPSSVSYGVRLIGGEAPMPPEPEIAVEQPLSSTFIEQHGGRIAVEQYGVEYIVVEQARHTINIEEVR